MDLGLQDRVYLVTGGIRGLGFAAAQALVAEGARVLISVGGSPGGTIAATADDAWRSAFESVFLGAIRLARSVAVSLAGQRDDASLSGTGGSIAFVLAASVRAPLPGGVEGIIQGEHELVGCSQGVRQNGLRCSGLAEYRGDDEDPARARPVPGRDDDAPAGGLRAAGLEAGDPVLAEQRVVVADQAGLGHDRGGHPGDRGQGGHAHRRPAQADLIGGGAGGGRVQAGRVGVAGGGQAQAAGGGVHPRDERGLAAGVPPRQDPGHVVGRGQQQRLQRLPLGQPLPGDDRDQRVAVPGLRRVGGRLPGLDFDDRPRSGGGQRMVAQDHVRGHHLGHAGDRHRTGRARSLHHAVAGDVGGRDAAGRPRDGRQPLGGRPALRRERRGGRRGPRPGG